MTHVVQIERCCTHNPSYKQHICSCQMQEGKIEKKKTALMFELIQSAYNIHAPSLLHRFNCNFIVFG